MPFNSANDTQGMQRSARNEGGTPYLAPWLLLCSKIDQNSRTSGSVARFNIVEDITDKPGSAQIEIKIGSGPQ
jgi:hypothetical protein